MRALSNEDKNFLLGKTAEFAQNYIAKKTGITAELLDISGKHAVNLPQKLVSGFRENNGVTLLVCGFAKNLGE